jgi:hypothetical protein
VLIERDLKTYLYENPEILLPGLPITSKRKEVYIGGLRIDLLFDIDGIQYIVEQKRDTIKRDTIGQIFEYYALMRKQNEDVTYKMILVAPSIPVYRRDALEAFGIRCIEVTHWPETSKEVAELVTESVKHQKQERKDAAITKTLPPIMQIRFEDIIPPVTPTSLVLSHQLLRDGLLDIERAYSAEYEIRAVKMVSRRDLLGLSGADFKSALRFTGVGAWWAYAMGHSEEVPKNDFPNISVNAYPWGLDFAINAELQTSQKVMRQRIAEQSDRFDGLVNECDGLRLQAWLKIEHQPQTYHWFLLSQKEKGAWRSSDLLDYHREMEGSYPTIRAKWLDAIKAARPELTPKQIAHMERTNRNLNLAFRLVHVFEKDDIMWGLPYEEQKVCFGDQYRKFKPLIDFFNE